MIGKPNFARMKKTMANMMVIQNRRPLSGNIRFIRVLYYCKKTNQDRKEAGSLHKGSDDEHGCTDVSC